MCKNSHANRQGKIWKRINLPPIGMRMVKSSIAILLCYLVSALRGADGIVFYSQLAALWCIQVYVKNAHKMAVQRFSGTVIGALYGLLVIITTASESSIITTWREFVHALLIALMIIVVLYTTVLLKRKEASYFSCVVFLSIVVNHLGDQNPYLFVWNRFLDTVIGIAIGMFVMWFHVPKEHHPEILFVSGLDDTLLNPHSALSDFSRIELNRLLDKGLQFTIATTRTPASLMEPLAPVKLKLPVVAMDGAVLYDINDKMYKKAYVLSPYRAQHILECVYRQGLPIFTNVIIDDMLVIYYEDTDHPVYNDILQKMRKSPYRNYVKRPLPPGEDVVYFMLVDTLEATQALYHLFEEEGITKEIKILHYPSTDYPGYYYLKLYNHNASKNHMLRYLQEELGLDKMVTFGSIPNQYDYYIAPGDNDRIIKIMKKQFETPKSLHLAKKK